MHPPWIKFQKVIETIFPEREGGGHVRISDETTEKVELLVRWII